MFPNMPLLVPLTQLSSLRASNAQLQAPGEPVLDKVIGKIQNHRQAELETASLRAQTQTTKTLIDVLAKEQRPLSPEQQQNLRQQHSQAQASQAPSEFSSLKQLLAKNELFLVKLLVNNKTQWAISSEKIATNKALNVSIESAKVWRATTAIDKPLSAKQIISQALRENLPRAENVTTVLRTLSQLTQQAAREGVELPRQIQAAVNRLQQLTQTPAALTQSHQLATIIRQSGSLYENKVAEVYQRHIHLTHHEQLLLSSKGSKLNTANALDKIFLSLFSSKKGRSQQAPGQRLIPRPSATSADSLIEPKSPGNSLNKDIKAQLIILKLLADTFLKSTSQTPKPSIQQGDKTTTLLLPTKEKTTLLPIKQHQANNTSTKLMQQIQQQAVAAIAKIQLQQAQSLLQSNLQAGDGKAPSTVLQLEIPVQIDQNLHALQVKIEQDWIDKLNQQDHSEHDHREKEKRWLVSLCFDLPKVGMFYARITHIEYSTQVQFWADEPETLEKARTKLELLKIQLQAHGICVNEIRCEPGLPATLGNKIHCALVDVCT